MGKIIKGNNMIDNQIDNVEILDIPNLLYFCKHLFSKGYLSEEQLSQIVKDCQRDLRYSEKIIGYERAEESLKEFSGWLKRLHI